MPIDFGTLANINKHATRVADILGGGLCSEIELVKRLKLLVDAGDDTAKRRERRDLMSALDGLALNLRVLRSVTFEPVSEKL